MAARTRVLDPSPVTSLDGWKAAGGGDGLAAAVAAEPAAVRQLVSDAGLRGRGGAGFPTGTKWETVASMATGERPTVVVNAAEGEPGSFKDRAILRANPYRVLEGALIAAHAVSATRVVVGAKQRFTAEVIGVRRAAQEMVADGVTDLTIDVIEGPSAYLYGEETALLEVIAGRRPFPRVAPPYRHGAEEVTDDPGHPAATDMATDTGATAVAPTLVNNVETLANVPGIVVHGADWFREAGTAESPGTIVVTVAGDVRREGVGEFDMGTPLAEVLSEIAGGPREDRSFVAALSGVSNPFIPAERFTTPLTHEAMTEAGTGLGATGFVVVDDATDLIAVAQGVAQFLAVESCGQCRPCKHDGVAIADELANLRQSTAGVADLSELRSRLATVDEGARCALAGQQIAVVGSLLSLFEDHVWTHSDGGADAAEPYLVAPIEDYDAEQGAFVLETSQATKQPDWSHDTEWSGRSPAEDLDEAQTRVAIG